MTNHSESNSWFDPPLEQYRFYQQGDAVNEKKVAREQTGLFMKQRKNTKFDDDNDESEIGGNTFPTNKDSLTRGNGYVYGSTLSGRDKSSRRSLYTDDKDPSNQSLANVSMYGNS